MEWFTYCNITTITIYIGKHSKTEEKVSVNMMYRYVIYLMMYIFQFIYVLGIQQRKR